MKLEPIEPTEIGGVDGGLSEAVTEEGYLRTLPCHLPGQGGMDGFFAARFEKARE
jgi:16S rRNA (cytosine967-C5)-methyltransferase